LPIAKEHDMTEIPIDRIAVKRVAPAEDGSPQYVVSVTPLPCPGAPERVNTFGPTYKALVLYFLRRLGFESAQAEQLVADAK
jgi:hypothetical protein